MRILLVEDEVSIRQLVQMNLELENYEVETAENGMIALEKVEEAHYDLIILDLMLPKVSGMDVLTRIRLNNSQLPIIITSAKDTSSDRIQGLKSGADDYLTKPFEMEELLLRIHKLLERTQSFPSETEPDTFVFGPNQINFKEYIASNASRQFELKPKEMQLMKFLISKKNEVVSRQDILKNVWGYDVYPSTRTVDNFIATLRKYFEPDVKNPIYIKSIRGIGYKFMD